MLATASTRTVMRWRWCSRCAHAALTVVVAVVTACVTTTTRFYLPSTEQGTITEEQLRDQASALLGIECARLHANEPVASGVIVLTAEVDSAGGMRRVRVDHGSGDKRVDDIMGGLAAQLALVPPPEGGRMRFAIAYTCSPGSAAVTVEKVSG